MGKRPMILITNDDGIFSPGITTVASAVKDLGETLIVAPIQQRTASGRAIAKDPNGGMVDRISLDVDGKIHTAYAVYGTPAEAASHAVLELAPYKPSLCIAGINYGENVGTGIFVSGTLGSALEASTYGIPGLVMSVQTSIKMQRATDYYRIDWSAPRYFTSYFAKYILAHGLPKGVNVLNVCVPKNATENTPIRVTRQSMQDYYFFKKPPKRDFSKKFQLQIEVRVDKSTLEPDSDIKALRDGVVSVTPIVQDMTARVEWKPKFKNGQD